MVIHDLMKRIHETNITENNDVTLQCSNGQVHTSKLFLASWSKFWKELLLGFDHSEDVVIVLDLLDVNKSVLNKLCKFLGTGKVIISGAQVVEGLEMLLPDLDLGDQKKLVIEDTEDETEETIMKTDCDNFRYEVTKNFVCNLCLTHFSSKQKR